MEYAFFSTNVVVAYAICIAAAAATMIGGVSVIATRGGASPRVLAFGLAFAGGAMVYISLVEIFWKAHDAFLEIHEDKTAYSYATLSFFAGIGLLMLLDRLIPNPHNKLSVPEGSEKEDRAHLGRVGMLAALAITAHNFPEGMATFFATLEDATVGTALAFAIAVHNIPEGVSIAIPVYYATRDKWKTLLACFVSAIAEPIGAFLGYVVLAPFLTPFVFGSVFGVIAGAMVFLAMDELLPTAKKHASGHDAVYGMVIGMACIALSLVLFR